MFNWHTRYLIFFFFLLFLFTFFFVWLLTRKEGPSLKNFEKKINYTKERTASTLFLNICTILTLTSTRTSSIAQKKRLTSGATETCLGFRAPYNQNWDQLSFYPLFISHCYCYYTGIRQKKKKEKPKLNHSFESRLNSRSTNVGLDNEGFVRDEEEKTCIQNFR